MIASVVGRARIVAADQRVEAHHQAGAHEHGERQVKQGQGQADAVAAPEQPIELDADVFEPLGGNQGPPCPG